MGTSFKFSSAYDPSTDKQIERTIWILENMLRACILEMKGDWEGHFTMVEFSFNNIFQAIIKMGPYKALYGRKCKSLLCLDDVGERKILGPKYLQEVREQILLIRERI